MDMPPDWLEDCISVGYEALLKSARRYDPNRGVPFKSFAFLRIRGAVVDYLHRHGFRRPLQSSDGVCDERKRFEGQETALLNVLDYTADLCVMHRLLFWEESELISDELTPEEAALWREEMELIPKLVDKLSAQDRAILRDRYFSGKPFHQIAEDLGVSRGWLSRLHGKALSNLRTLYLTSAEEDETFAADARLVKRELRACA